MALTRKLLRGMSLTEEQVETIIEAHTETVNGLKDDLDTYKESAEKLLSVQKELDELKKQSGDSGKVVAKDEYDRLKNEYETFKSDTIAKETKTAKDAAYRNLLKEAGIDPKRIDAIVKITDIGAIELTEDGKIKDAETRTATVKTDFSDFIIDYSEKGAAVATPPGSNGAESDPFLAGFDEG